MEGFITVAFADAGESREKVKLVVAGVIFLVAGGVAWFTLGGQSQLDLANERVYMCNECGEFRPHLPREGEIEPLKCPKCGAMAYYETEKCFWTKGSDGEWKAKTQPSFAILKQRIDPNSTEETFCPDCGRKVVGRNPLPPEDLMAAAEAEEKGQK